MATLGAIGFAALSLVLAGIVLWQRGRTARMRAHNAALVDAAKAETAAALAANREAEAQVAFLRERNSHLETEILNMQATESALQDAREQAEIASRAKSAFLASMSHELRTPLNAILGFSEVLTGDFGVTLPKERIREYADDIRASGLMLLDLINDLLDLARIEEGRFELREAVIDMPDLVQGALRMMRPSLESKGLTTKIVMPDDPLIIHGDGRGLRQVLLNLLSNSVKFTPGGGKITLTAAIDAITGDVLLSVADSGIGIPQRDLSRVTEPFHRLNQEVKPDATGTGLGLPLAKALVELHGGSLTIASTVGHGTTVTVRLPKSRHRSSEAA